MTGNRPPVFAAVDWGTSRFRLWLIDSDGLVVAERRSDDGLDASRAHGFAETLERHLSAIGAPGGTPVVICGMAGSRQGWIEAPYVDIPARLSDILSACLSIPGLDRDIRIIPGLAQRGEMANVMRGEETQLLGFALGKDAPTALVAMPGTHSKWVHLEKGRITCFSTHLTGELYALLSSQSILRHSIGDAANGVEASHPQFLNGLRSALGDGGSILGQLFGIRSAMLLEGLAPDAAAARLSGLLIGAEIADARRSDRARNGPVVLIASGRMLRLYQAGFAAAGMATEDIDADDAVRRGLFAAATALWFDGP